MKRTLIMKIHGYLSMFFFIPMMMYLITGIAYIFGYTGTTEYKNHELIGVVAPASQAEAELILPKALEVTGLETVPGEFRERNGSYQWNGLKYRLSIESKDGVTIVKHGESDFFRQMFMVHKAHAGTVFDILGVASGIYLLLVLVTGFILVLKTTMIQSGSYIAFGIGLITMIASYFAAIA